MGCRPVAVLHRCHVVVDVASKLHTLPTQKAGHGLPASGGMPSLPHIGRSVVVEPMQPSCHALTISRLGSAASGDTVRQTLPVVGVVTKPCKLGDRKPTQPFPDGRPNRTLPTSGGAAPFEGKEPTQALPACKATPCSPGQASGPGLPTSGGATVLPVVQCLGRAEGHSKRRYTATVSLAEIPESGPKKKRLTDKTMPWWRVNAGDDLAMVADLFGGDLGDVTMPASGGSVPSAWFNYDACVEVLREHGINPARIDALEVYAGCANWSSSCRLVGLLVGVPIDNRFNKTKWNLLSAKWRRVLWAIVVVCQPRWIHSGFPCTFWVRLAHLSRKKSQQENEADRLREMVHIVVTLQLARWQHQRGLMMSLENPPDAQSWKLDIVVQTLTATNMKLVQFDSCAWGHCDPESNKPYLKRQCIAAFASVDLSPLVRRCSCPGGRQLGVHERIQGMTSVSGQPGKVLRSAKSGEYPLMLCHAWARIVKEHLRSP